MANTDVAKVDLLGKTGGLGEIAALGRLDIGRLRPYVGSDGRSYITVYKGGDPADVASYEAVSIQTNATLRPTEWKELDEAVIKVAEKRLIGVGDLVANGLVYDLSNGLGTTVLEYHDLSDALAAELSMDGISRARGDRPTYSVHYLPLPIVHADYEINARVLEASRRLGNPLDTTMAERAARKVAEKLEQMLFSDVTYSFGGGTIYSYVNFPGAQEVDMSKAWNDPTKTASEILEDVLAMKQKAIDANFYGPWMLYVPTAYETVLDKDYDTTRGVTVRQRILMISGIKDVKVIDYLPDDYVILVQMTSDVVRLVRGLPIQNIEWQAEGQMVTLYKVLTIQVPQIRSNPNGKSGIVRLYPIT